MSYKYLNAILININYFTSCDPHHDIYICCYWQIFWHSPGISSGICSGISSGILSGKSSGILSGKSSGILSGISSGISSDILSGILSGTFYLANILALYLAYLLAFYLAYLLDEGCLKGIPPSTYLRIIKILFRHPLSLKKKYSKNSMSPYGKME